MAALTVCSCRSFGEEYANTGADPSPSTLKNLTDPDAFIGLLVGYVMTVVCHVLLLVYAKHSNRRRYESMKCLIRRKVRRRACRITWSLRTKILDMPCKLRKGSLGRLRWRCATLLAHDIQ